MELILHIGSDKCGSTAIQTSLAINRKKLVEDHGVYVPISGLGKGNGHSECFMDKTGARFAELIEELKSIESEYETAIVSWEGIHFIPNKQLVKKYGALKQFDAKALYYVRDQAEIIQSGMLQQWKTSNCGLRFEKSTPDTRNYFATAERWSEFLGEKTEVVVFDRGGFPKGDVVLDFYSRITQKKLTDLKHVGKDFNESLAYEAGYLISLVERNFHLQEDERRDLVDAFINSQRSYELSKYFFTEEEVAEVRGYYSSDNKYLKTEYGADLFLNLKPCWSELDKRENPHPELLAQSLALYNIPALKFKRNDGLVLRRAMGAGWHSVEDWGAWAKGKESRLSFRVKDRVKEEVELRSKQIMVRITGRYYDQAEKKTDLEVNGRAFKDVDLSDFSFALDAVDVPSNGVINILIRNGQMVSPRSSGKGDDVRELGFGVEGVNMVAVRSRTEREEKKNQKRRAQSSDGLTNQTVINKIYSKIRISIERSKKY